MLALPRLILLSGFLAASLLSPVRAADLHAGGDGHDHRVPYCDEPSVQSAVRDTIARADVAYRGGLTIEAMYRIDETGYRHNQPSPYARRFCRAKAQLSNGRTGSVFYLIEEYQGFAGIGWNVQACLPGHDRWHVYDAQCRVVRR